MTCRQEFEEQHQVCLQEYQEFYDSCLSGAYSKSIRKSIAYRYQSLTLSVTRTVQRFTFWFCTQLDSRLRLKLNAAGNVYKTFKLTIKVVPMMTMKTASTIVN